MSNGLTLDRQGQALAAEHDGRRVSRVADNGTRTVLAEQYQGKRLNSPNDIVVKSDGSIYFTDPPYAIQPSTPGMPRPAGWWTAPIPGKELPYNGVYRLTPDGTLHLLVDDFALPNGLAFSPDESVLYIDDSAHKHIRAFDVRPDGSLANSRILLDMASEDPGVPDGLKVDQQGNVFCTGPGGVWVCRADGTRLGRIVLPELPANLAWGEDTGHDLRRDRRPQRSAAERADQLRTMDVIGIQGLAEDIDAYDGNDQRRFHGDHRLVAGRSLEGEHPRSIGLVHDGHAGTPR